MLQKMIGLNKTSDYKMWASHRVGTYIGNTTVSNEEQIPRIYQYNACRKKNWQPNRKVLNKKLHKNDKCQETSKYSSLLIIKDIEIKTTMRYHYTFIQIAKGVTLILGVD